MGSVSISIQLLQKLSQSNFDRVEFAARFLAHASDVVAIVARRYNDEKKNSEAQILSPALMGLFQFTARQIKLAGTGRLESIHPEIFVEICDSGQFLQEERSHINKNKRSHINEQEESLFLNSVLPEVLISWILDAYPSVVSSQKLSGRWLSLIPNVYNYHIRQSRHSFPERQKAALVTRFLSPGYSRRPDNNLNWKYQLSRGKTHWKVNPRQLLLTERLHPDEWFDSQWDDDRVDWGSDPNAIVSNRLVYTLECLDAIGHYLPNYEIEPTVLESTFSDWKHCLNSVGQAKNLDRFTRLRLLEFLDSSILENRAEEQILLASVLVEYGSIYDIKNMFERVYPTEADGITFKQVGEARQKLQVALLPIIFSRLEKDTDLRLEFNEKSDEFPRLRRVESLWDLQKKVQFIQLFEEWMAKLIYLSNFLENAENFSGLSVKLSNLRCASLDRQASTTTRSIILNVELQNDQKLLVFAPDDPPPADLAIKAIDYNPNRLTATVFYEDFETAGVSNLFKKVEIRTLHHESDPPLNVLAVVVDVTEIEQDEPYRWKYTFDCGFKFLLTYSSDSSLNLKPGDRVKLPIRQFKEENKLRWRVSHRHSIKSLARSSRPGDINKICVDEIWKDGRRTWSVKRTSNTQNITEKLNLRLWDADISRCFCQCSQSLKHYVFAQLNTRLEWIPLDLDFSDLLFQVFHPQQCSNIAVLTLMGETIGLFGEKAWRFSRQPGENYLIEQHRFLGDSAEDFAKKLADYQNRAGGAVGLLISVTPDFESGRVGLRLATDDAIIPVAVDEFYPKLRVPFDDRNIRWRELFDSSAERLNAKKNDDSNWFFDLPEKKVIPGYPRQVSVEWDNNSPHRNLEIADFDISQWKEEQWRKASIKGEIPPFYEITPQNKDWKAFLDRWLNLPDKVYQEPGFRVKLSRSLGSVERDGDGYVLCLTSEKIRVFVQAESLTMIPLEHQEKPRITKDREAEVFWIEWLKISIEPIINNIILPPNAKQNHQCVGIVTRVPKFATDGTPCQVVWQASHGSIEEQSLQIDNLSELRISQGDKIVGRQRPGGKWVFQIEKPKIRARAFWSLKPWKSGKRDGLYYLGIVADLDGGDLEIAESKSFPGQLVCLPRQPYEISHLAQSKVIKSKDLKFNERSIWEDNLTSNTARHRYAFDEPPFQRPYQYRRAVLPFEDRQKLLIGDCHEWIGDEKVTIQTIKLVLKQRDDGKCVLQRRFNLRPIRDIKPQGTRSDTDRWKQKLEDYLRKSPPEPLRATFTKNRGELGFLLSKGGDNEVRVPENSSGKNWTLWVPLAASQSHFVMGSYDSDQARICLFIEQQRVWASCRLVPPLTLEEFRVNYCEAPTLNTDVFLFRDKNTRLYYVGPEAVNHLTNESYTEIHHRFEMGYGETLLVPESQLEFDDELFSKAQLFIFYGDLIKVVSFKERKSKNGTNHQVPQFTLNIKGIHIRWSEARQLYYQRSRYQIVHLIHLKPRGKDIEISYIDGFNDRFNENSIAQQRKFEPKNFKAYLTPDSKVRLSNRRQRWVDESEQDPVIFGRLDEERFRSSYGKDIYFDHIRLSFVESSKGLCLFNKDLVFLNAGQIKLLKNDMGLTLNPPKGFDSEDVGKDAKDLLLLRRNFSVRESLLKQVYEEKGENYFQDDRLLIQLTKYNDRITSRLLMVGDSVPARSVWALLGAVSNLGKAGLLATIVDAKEANVVQIEYKPGIFVRIQAARIKSRSPKLPRGTIVRIEASDGKFSITRAAFGNAEYVPQGIRPAVILPTNDIQESDSESWVYRGRFSIGNLPDIISFPGRYTNERWEKAVLSEVIMMMARQHPKHAILGKDAKGNYRIAPPSNEFPCGRLTRIDNSMSVQYASLNSEPTSLSNSSIPSYLLSFGDESVQQIFDRANAESWRYHDNKTFTWVSDAQKFNVETLQNRDHTVWTGPIFFQLLRGKLRLRYSQSNFRRFGFPVEELIYALKQQDRSHCYPIAGIFSGSSQSREYSLWIELAPGRLVELPVQLIVWRSGVNKKAKSLTNLMHWQGLAPGDRVELELVSTDPLTIDRIALKNWIPGVRNALGSSRCFLPIEVMNEKQGEITLGRGEFKLNLPFADRNPNWQMAILTPDNDIQGITATSDPTKNQPKRNDVVFLEINAQDKLAVIGFETMIPILDKGEADAWKSHPITGCLIRQRLTRQQPELCLDFTQLKNWIRAAGGALPVTVEGLHKTESRQLLFISMRHQQDAALIPPGCISLARFVDLLPDQSTVMLRCGGGLLALPMRQIISGLDRSLYATVVKQLKQAQVSLWLGRDRKGKMKVGLNDDSGHQDLLVKSLDILIQKNGEEDVGLICQSIDEKKLYWLPVNEAAWTTLSVSQFRDLFKSKGVFKVRSKLIEHKNKAGITSKIDIISVLAVPDVFAESKKLIVGQELFVKVIKQVETNDKNKQRYLVESLTTSAILDCEIYERQRLYPDETLPVEVLQHIKGNPELITVVPVGNKRKYLDLPTWMTKQLPEPGKCRESISEYMKWRTRQRLSKLDIKKLECIDNSSDRLLCHYFNDAYGAYGQEATNLDLERQLKIAKQWYKENKFKTEINAVFALMAILLLHKHEETKCEAYLLTQNLGLRALRSLHIEVLYHRWLSIKDNRERTDGLWQRLLKLDTDKHLYTPLKETSPNALRQFCNAVEMRSDSELIPIAKSLSATLGELSSITELENHALITKKLIDIHITFHPQSRIKKLQKYQINKIQEVLKLIDINKFDIMLLEPLSLSTTINSQNEDVEPIELLDELFPEIQIKANRISCIKQQIDYLDYFSNQFILFEQKTQKIKNRFDNIRKFFEN